MTTDRLMEELEELEERYRTLAEWNEKKAAEAGPSDRMLVYGGHADAYDQAASMLSGIIRHAKTWM